MNKVTTVGHFFPHNIIWFTRGCDIKHADVVLFFRKITSIIAFIVEKFTWKV